MTENGNNSNNSNNSSNNNEKGGETRRRSSGQRKKGIDAVMSRAIEKVLAAGQGSEAKAPEAKKPQAKKQESKKQEPPKQEVQAGEVKKPRSRGRGRAKAEATVEIKATPELRAETKAEALPTGDKPRAKRTQQRPARKSGEYKLRVIPLGGLGEVGKNMMLIEYGEDILVVDGGLSFPEDGMYGIDLVIPDHSYLIEHRDKLRAYLLTHGHEDHIGGMAYILPNAPAPVYGLPLTLGLLKGKLAEHRINGDLRPVAPREELEIGPFRIEFIRVTHSIPDSMGLAIHTPVGTVMIISDFKMDMSPIDGKLMDFGRISAIGEKGVLLLMSDSTNVERDGFCDSERSVGYNLDKIFFNAKGRIIVTSFASHVHRVQQALWAAQRTGRKVAICGRGMLNMTAVATQMGYLEVPDKLLIDVDSINNFPANRVVIITTGSQGEPMSGLSRMASGEHKQVQIMSGDTVVISATPIPGNERMVSKTVDNLFRLGASVVYERSQGIHVSGHACREELKVLLNMVKPRFFAPIHGEYRMLYKHAQLAQGVGMPEENTIILENGNVLELSRRSYRLGETVPSGRILIDGLGVGDVGASVLRERRQLSEAGVIVINMVYSKKKGKGAQILCEPELSTRGFIFEKGSEHIIVEIKEKVAAICTGERLSDGNLHDLRNMVRSAVGKLVMERTGRRPVIMAAIYEV